MLGKPHASSSEHVTAPARATHKSAALYTFSTSSMNERTASRG